MSFVDDIKAATERVETPWSFIQWACYAAVAATVKNNVWLNKDGVYNLYCNMYVIIIGKAGLRKGYAAWLARELVYGVNNVKIISGQGSIQGILDEMKNSNTEEGSTTVKSGAQVFLTSEEFSTLILEDPQSYRLLTTLYDTHAHQSRAWEKKLRDIRYVIKQPCITMFGASNMRLLEEVLPPEAYEGGFVGRLIAIHETKRRCRNSLTGKNSQPIDLQPAINALKVIATKRGCFTWSDAGQKLYNDWYMSWDSESKDDMTGFLERIHEHILKLAMIISLINRGDMLLDEEDIKEAMDICFSKVSNVSELTEGKGKSSLGQATKVVLKFLFSRKEGMGTRKELLRRFYGEFSAQELDQIILTLTNAKAINTKMIGQDLWLVLTQEIKDFYAQMDKKDS